MQRPSVLVLCLILSALAQAPAAAQILNPSFDANAFGTPLDWVPHGTGGNIALQFLPDVGMPQNGARYVVLDAGTSGPATPHSNPGGIGTGSVGTVSLSQSFSFSDTSMTMVNFDCVLLGNDNVADFFDANISDGQTTLNLVHLDVLNSLGGAGASFTGLPHSGVVSVSVDIGTHFPAATFATVFTLSFHIGNLTDSAQPSRAYVDDIFLSPGTPFAENSIRFIPNGSWVQLAITTEAPFMEYYNVISHETSFPKGSGPFGGIWPDAQTWAFVTMPLGSTGIHDFSNAMGEFDISIWGGLAPAGFNFDYFLAVVLPGGAGYRLTPVKRGAWNVAEDL